MLQGVAQPSRNSLDKLFLFSSLLVVAGCCVLSGVSVVSRGVSFTVVAGICAASSAVAVALIALGGKKSSPGAGFSQKRGTLFLVTSK